MIFFHEHENYQTDKLKGGIGAGQLDLLLNNATFQANVFTPLAMIREALPAMQARGTGTVINMLSATACSDPPAPPDAGGRGFAYVKLGLPFFMNFPG